MSTHDVFRPYEPTGRLLYLTVNINNGELEIVGRLWPAGHLLIIANLHCPNTWMFGATYNVLRAWL